MDDKFISSYIGDLLRSLRTYYLIDLIKPYTRLELSFLAKVGESQAQQRLFVLRAAFIQQLNVEIHEVEDLLIGLILEGKVDGRIDQVGMKLELNRKYALSSLRYPLMTESCPQTKSGEKAVHCAREMDRGFGSCTWCGGGKDRWGKQGPRTNNAIRSIHCPVDERDGRSMVIRCVSLFVSSCRIEFVPLIVEHLEPVTFISLTPNCHVGQPS